MKRSVTQDVITEDLERYVLGLCLHDPGATIYCSTSITSSDFRNSFYGEVFDWLVKREKRSSWDFSVMLEQMGYPRVIPEGKPADGRYDTLQDIYAKVLPPEFNASNPQAAGLVDSELESILKLSRKRSVVLESPAIIELADDYNSTLEEIQSALMVLQQKLLITQRVKSWRDETLDYISLVETRFETRGTTSNLGTGMPTIDNCIRSIRPGQLIVIGALFKVGKSSLLAGLCSCASIQNNVPGLIISLEMDISSWFDMFFSMHAQIDSKDLEEGTLREADFPNLVRVAQLIGSAHLFIIERNHRTPTQIFNLIRYYALRYGVKYVAIDHVQLVRFPPDRRQKHELISEFTGDCKALAGELGIAIIILSQLNAQGGTFGSSMIIGDLDKFILIEQHDPSDERFNDMTEPEIVQYRAEHRIVSVPYHRGGATASCTANFIAKYHTFREENLTAGEYTQTIRNPAESKVTPFSKEVEEPTPALVYNNNPAPERGGFKSSSHASVNDAEHLANELGKLTGLPIDPQNTLF